MVSKGPEGNTGCPPQIFHTTTVQYSYANSDFHPADRVEIYYNPKRLDQTYLLRDAAPYERLDMDLRHNRLKRVLRVVPGGGGGEWGRGWGGRWRIWGYHGGRGEPGMFCSSAAAARVD